MLQPDIFLFTSPGVMQLKFLLIVSTFFLISCSSQSNRRWEQKNITATLHSLFPDADSVIVLDQTQAVADNRDTIGLPLPLYKAVVKEKQSSVNDFIFFFYESNIMDTTLYLPLLKQILIYDLKTGLGTKKPDYLLPLPLYDSSGSNKMMVFAVAVATAKDSAYLYHKQQEIYSAFGLSATTTKINKNH